MVATLSVRPGQSATDHRSFRVRPARRHDMDVVADFIRSSADWYRPFVDEDDMSQHDVADSWAEENFQKRDFYIGSVGPKPIGTVSLQYFGDYAYVGYLYLDVKHVSRGYGRKLLRFAENLARGRGMRGLVLIAHPRATWAKRAYLRYGFRIIESQRQGVLSWQDGVLRPYYENGFELYELRFDSNTGSA